MENKYLLDTMIIEALYKGRDNVGAAVQKHGSDAIFTSVVTRAEILRKRFDYILKESDPIKVANACEWLSKYETFLSGFNTLSFDAAAGDELKKLRAIKKLKKIGLKDLKIASIAFANNLTVVTQNIRDFKNIPNLAVENWMS